jgi:hypothetical protein
VEIFQEFRYCLFSFVSWFFPVIGMATVMAAEGVSFRMQVEFY